MVIGYGCRVKYQTLTVVMLLATREEESREWMGVTGASVDQLPAATISTMGSGGGNHVIRVTGSVTLCISAPENEHPTIKS